MTQWSITFTCPNALEQTVNDYLMVLDETGALSVGWHASDQEDLWNVEAIFANRPDVLEISTQLALVAAVYDIAVPLVVSQEINNTDWLEQTWRNFPAQQIGRYYVYGSHYQGEIPSGLLGIEMNAATAFGSGEHATTQGCLQSFNALAAMRNFSNALDMGCGSGILAIAIAKTWNCPVLAVDNDPEAVRVTVENVATNNCSSLVVPLLSEGFAEDEVRACGPYQLIVANILAKPLCLLAADIADNLGSEGMVILSGLLSRQAEEVLGAYRSVGLTSWYIHDVDDWTTLVLHKRN